MDLQTLHARFQGDVQGVGFRATAAHIARRAGLSGWVMNLSDGSVRLEATGARTELEKFLLNLRRSPVGPGIHTEDLSFLEAPSSPSPRFEIRYF